MLDLLNSIALVIGWIAIAAIGTALGLAVVFALWCTIDFVGRYIACKAFAHKAHWHKPEDTRWERTQRAASIAWYTLWHPRESFHSRNNYLIELVYHHPFRWHLINHWDLMPDNDEDEDEASDRS